MSEIGREIPPIPATSLPDLVSYLEQELGRMQQEVYRLRQFVEPLVKQNDNCPEQEFNPLE